MSMIRSNPTQQPQVTHARARVVGQSLVGPSPMILGDICVKCGQAHMSGKRYDKKLYWAPRWLAITVLISPLIYIILWAFTKKKLDISYFRCEECTSKANKISIAAVLSWVGFFGVIPLAVAVDVMGLMIAMLPLFIIALVLTVKASGPLRPEGHNMGVFMIAGAHPIFLQQIDTEVVNTFS